MLKVICLLHICLFMWYERTTFATPNETNVLLLKLEFMKTLNEQVNEIVNGKGSKAVKKASLIKLGLTSFEIDSIILSAAKAKKAGKKFDASSLTFGVEIECYNVLRSDLISHVRQRSISIESEGYNHNDNERYYKIVSDASIHGANGQEVVSPILKGENGMNSLKMVCDSLVAVGARVNKSTGLHIHFDASSISDEHFINIFRNYQAIESVIDSFMPMSRRENNNGYCRSLVGLRYGDCQTKRDIINLNGTRYRKVNAESYLRHKTIEFRQHSGTIEYKKISNWILFLRELINYSEKNEIQSCTRIEDLPFLTDQQKEYFINRRAALN